MGWSKDHNLSSLLKRKRIYTGSYLKKRYFPPPPLRQDAYMPEYVSDSEHW